MLLVPNSEEKTMLMIYIDLFIARKAISHPPFHFVSGKRVLTFIVAHQS